MGILNIKIGPRRGNVKVAQICCNVFMTLRENTLCT